MLDALAVAEHEGSITITYDPTQITPDAERRNSASRRTCSSAWGCGPMSDQASKPHDATAHASPVRKGE